MISNTTIIFILISAVVCFLIPVAAFIYFKKTEGITFKPVLIGLLTFVIFTQVLERLLHSVVFTNNLIKNSILLTVYGALAAGVFEEVGRFIMYKAFLKKNRQWGDGVAFGIGHGGIEAILVGGFSFINLFIYGLLINSGNIEKLTSKLPANMVEQIKTALMGPSASFLLGGVERLFAFIIQIGLSILVLYAIKERKNIYVLLAVILHAMIDFPAGLYQFKIINSVIGVEAMVMLIAVISLVYIVKSKKVFERIK